MGSWRTLNLWYKIMSVSHNMWGNIFIWVPFSSFNKYNFLQEFSSSSVFKVCYRINSQKKVLKTRLYTLGVLLKRKAPVNYRNMSFSEKKKYFQRKSMSGVNSGWSNYLLSLHSFQSECWAWLSEYNPLILFCSLIRKPGNGQMRLDRCWKSGLIFLIARCTSDTLFSPLCDPSLERKRNDIYLLEVFLPFTTKKFFC